ncbi:hypothetical protein [Chamaesiphon polymorphus]|uniref:Outer membrane protein beta-barrel domain-containing protein n=1 Tax=Chamaesiphon polymorphus CCALA 037 TaxID=2107692 RepID=A0A2T1G4I9_9CYAN|nr:hypothetical protein [Chamaesiphon polymorphus]PSB52070.1 hypothetical protein C7B77_20900 [Chamaesiphon polymorphus CCALA 037]
MSQFFTRFLQLTLCGLTSLAVVNTLPVAAESAPQAENIGYQNNGYIGIGSAIGLGGNTTALGTDGVAILTKVRFSDNFSLHDATILFGGGAATSMIIVSADFPIRNNAGQTIISPFIGGGAMLRYDRGLLISPAISGGVDIPVSQNFTGTVRLNAGFPDNRNADVGILAGVGYNFGN